MQMTPVMQMLMNQLQAKNPKGHQAIQSLMQNNGNPQAILQQMMGNATPEQRQNLLSQAQNYGVPNEILSKIQNMK